jgi:chaperone BCS1
MSFSGGFRALKSTTLPPDNTTTSLTQLPANLLEAFIPGYSIISKFLLDVLGFDVTLVVSVCALAFGLYTAVKFIWKHAYAQFQEHFMSFISVDSDDDIYDHVMTWLQGQKMVKTSRSLVAKTSQQSIWDLEDEDEEMETLDQDVLLNFSNWDAKVPPEFQPYFGSHRFFHKGRYFEFTRATKPVMHQGWAGSIFQNDETIQLTCIGRSTQPIKDLLRECRDQYLNTRKASTIVRRPAPKENRSRGRSVWNTVATRPSRPLDTVVLDSAQKEALLADINEYLHPSTPRWYANRGIPYRRGYLFAGPPGTGKSSLAWAVAGVFGLDIYCISLVEPTLTEEDLGIMFTSLPRRCVVLLEDIDSAGLVKRQTPEGSGASSEEDATKAGGEKTGAEIGAEIAKAIKSANKNEKSKTHSNGSNEGISLSGLLNAIDGVASHEGRVLVMTTNFADKLDDALIRPGRIDMRIDFTLATRYQIRELFTRMYSPDRQHSAATQSVPMDPDRGPAVGNLHRRKPSKPEAGQADSHTPPHTPRSSTPAGDGNTAVPNKMKVEDPARIASIASQFAERIPENVFSPAEIQGFLLTRKKEPLRALDEVETWRDRLLEIKGLKNNQ